MHTASSGLVRKIIALVLVFLLFASTALASTAYVSCSSLVVRSSASTSGRKLGTLAQGAKVQVISSANGWAKISYGGKTGYVSTKYLSKGSSSSGSATTATARTKGYVKTGTYVYQKASASSAKLCVLTKGTLVYVVGKNGSFRKVQTTGGVTGYVKASALSKSASSSSSGGSKSGSKAATVISKAKSLLGSTYVSGCSGPTSFDCSGFTQYCYAPAGVYLSRLAYEQGYTNGTKVGKGSLRAGDLVFFNTEEDDADRCDHVGIYLGAGMFIHASSSAGRVIISTLSTGYYAQVFSWGRRVL